MDKMNIEPEARNTYRCQASCIKQQKPTTGKQEGKNKGKR
jgi:hypothetical protein